MSEFAERKMTISTRALSDGDHARWTELWAGYLTFYDTNLPPNVTELTWQRLLIPNEGHQGVVAIDEDGRVIGIAHYLVHDSTWSNGGYCYLEDLFVAPATRNSGAGRALIEAVEKAAKIKGCTRMYLATQEYNNSARGLYDKVMTLSPFVQYRRQLN